MLECDLGVGRILRGYASRWAICMRHLRKHPSTVCDYLVTIHIPQWGLREGSKGVRKISFVEFYHPARPTSGKLESAVPWGIPSELRLKH